MRQEGNGKTYFPKEQKISQFLESWNTSELQGYENIFYHIYASLCCEFLHKKVQEPCEGILFKQ